MKAIIPVILFFICNAIGYYLVITLYAAAPIYKFVDIETTDFLLNKQYEMGRVMMIWLACAIFSFASFFLAKKWRIVFLTAPIFMPFIFAVASIMAYI